MSDIYIYGLRYGNFLIIFNWAEQKIFAWVDCELKQVSWICAK
jgi:hypothetical protein